MKSESQTNDGAVLIGRVLSIKRSQIWEPEEYTSLGETLCAIRRVSGLTQEEVAYRLMITVGTLARAESDVHGSIFQFPVLERVSKLATDCHMPKVVEFIKVLSLFVRNKKQRGPKKFTGPFWEMKVQQD